jgi:hypothetical protein
MARKIALVTVLLAVGVAIALYLRGFGPAAADEVDFRPDAGASAEARIAELERALAAQIERSRSLDARLVQLETRQGQGERRGEGGAGNLLSEEQAAALRERVRAGFEGGERPDPATIRERARERQLQRFVDAGIPRERAEWIERRMEELEVQAMQARYDAQRTGQPVQGVIDPERALRKELGDVEYERYLNATGRPAQVQVNNVLASSAAERAGLQPGDQIVSYAGTRVFDMRELNALTTEGAAGETVTVEVRRNGETLQLQVPRGPLGMQGGGMRGPPGGGPPGGGPGGGFRGGR